MPREPKVSFFPLSLIIICEINPNPGRIRIYTSGCPKNQNKCWYKIGSPPPEGSKNEVFRFRSVSNIVIAPARTGNDNSNKIAVIKMDHTNKGIFSIDRLIWCIFKIVEIKLIAPKIEDIPAICKEKIDKSIEGPEWNTLEAKGG